MQQSDSGQTSLAIPAAIAGVTRSNEGIFPFRSRWGPTDRSVERAGSNVLIRYNHPDGAGSVSMLFNTKFFAGQPKQELY